MEEISLKQAIDLIKKYKNQKVLLTFHSIGDTDCISSAFALQSFFTDATIATPDFVTSNSRRIMEKLSFKENSIKKEFGDMDLIILLDVNKFEECGQFSDKLKKATAPILVIDHHSPNKIPKDNVFVFNSESYNSTASIIYEMLKVTKTAVDKKLANLIAAGIISDSAEFRNAFPKTFMQIGELLEKSGMDYPSMLLEMQHISDIKTRRTFTEDLFKSDIMEINGLLLIMGRSRIHANKLADDAIKIGADASLFYTEGKSEISFSARLRPPLDKSENIHLGQIMKKLAPIIKGQGGGHPCAAGAYGTGISNGEKFIDGFIKSLKKEKV